MKTTYGLLFMFAGYTTLVMAGGQAPIDLNEVHNFFQTHAAAINSMQLSGQTSVEPVLNQQIQHILQLLPTRGYVTIIPAGEYGERRVCTKELTEQMLAAWDSAYQKTYFYEPSHATLDQFFPTVFDSIAIALHVHGVI